MRYLSVCSGIEAATVAWHPLGWEPVAFSEIEAFPCAVLQHHYPSVPNWGDMTRFHEWPDAVFDVLVGGTPCQSFSVAGLRKGLADPRGNLAFTYLAIAGRYRPRWLVWENVPGVLSVDGGRALGAFIGGLRQLGYLGCWRVLDAQYFGLAQRRARVFVVGHLGDWRRAAAVLFERESLSGHPPPSREAGERLADTLTVGANQCSGRPCDFVETAPTIPSRSTAGGGLGTDFDCDGGLIASTGDISHCLNAGGMGRIDYETETLIAHSLRADGFGASEDGTGRGTQIVAATAPTLGQRMRGAIDSMFDGALVPIQCNGTNVGTELPSLRRGDGGLTSGVPAVAFDARQSDVIQYGEKTGPLDTDGHTIAVAFAENQRAELVTNDTAGSLKVGGGKPGQGYPAIQRGMQVRRLTPRECERLQGFPDDYTLIPYRGKPAADGPRYKALGNSMAVPVMRWIGKRIALVEEATA